MNFPIRVMLALFVIGAFGGIAVWGLVVVRRAERLTEAQRMIAATPPGRGGISRRAWGSARRGGFGSTAAPKSRAH